MFKHILVPLDGSRLAEAAIPAAVFFASKLGSSVTLIHIIEQNAPVQIHGERHLTDPDAACNYLVEVSSSSFPAGIPVDQHVHTTEVKDVSRSIVQHSSELEPDLIVMCTHGRSGLRDFLTGSIAQQVVGGGTTPVLLIHPSGEQAEFKVRNMLLPMDAKPAHEQSLPTAGELARAFSANLTLLTVVPTLGTLGGENAAAGRLMPGAMNALLQMNVESAEEYLRDRAARMITGVALNFQVLRGDPAPAIVEAAQQNHADLIILGTHGKAGSQAFWSGSVAPRMPGLTGIPLLFVPIHNAG